MVNNRCRGCPDMIDYGDHHICLIYGFENPGYDYDCPEDRQKKQRAPDQLALEVLRRVSEC